MADGCCLIAVSSHCLSVQVSLPTNFTQFLNATALKGVRIGVFRQIRCGVGIGKHWHPDCYPAQGSLPACCARVTSLSAQRWTERPVPQMDA